MWSPTHVEVTVQSARNLRVKGKHGTNDPYVTIQLGKEMYQTSVQQKTSTAEWHEECELTIPDGNTSAIVLAVFHRNFVGLDKFLGRVEVPLQELDIYERPRNKTFALRGKGNDTKERGELDVRFAFIVKSVAGSLLDLTKKQKRGGSLPLKMMQNLGGSLMSLGGKDKRLSLGHLKGSLGKLSDKLPRKRSSRKSDTVTEEREMGLDDFQFDGDDYSDFDNMSTASSSQTGGDNVPERASREDLSSPYRELKVDVDHSPNKFSVSAPKPISPRGKANFYVGQPPPPQSKDDRNFRIGFRNGDENEEDKQRQNTTRLSARNSKNHQMILTDNNKSRSANETIIGKAPHKNETKPLTELANQRTNIRSSIPKEILTLYDAMTKQELVDLLCKQHMIVEDQQCHIQDLEGYIDDLLVRVMDTTPRILQNPYKRNSSSLN